MYDIISSTGAEWNTQKKGGKKKKEGPSKTKIDGGSILNYFLRWTRGHQKRRPNVFIPFFFLIRGTKKKKRGR